jgi:hypothetical protein
MFQALQAAEIPAYRRQQQIALSPGTARFREKNSFRAWKVKPNHPGLV